MTSAIERFIGLTDEQIATMTHYELMTLGEAAIVEQAALSDAHRRARKKIQTPKSRKRS